MRKAILGVGRYISAGFSHVYMFYEQRHSLPFSELSLQGSLYSEETWLTVKETPSRAKGGLCIAQYNKDKISLQDKCHSCFTVHCKTFRFPTFGAPVLFPVYRHHLTLFGSTISSLGIWVLNWHQC